MNPEDQEQNGFVGVYDDQGRESLMKNDEISPEEEAFMAGYDREEEKKEETEDIYEAAFDKAVMEEKEKRKRAKRRLAAKKRALKKKAK
ncbi:hypothetical protein KY348_06825 [Candidatus Woesearchaeota archaeon]|nr:hypothetical protein [Candidatus Woesearchaeota archaeon]